MLYAEHTGRQLPVLDKSAPGRYAPGDASVGPINMGGEKKKEKHENKPQRCQPIPDNLSSPFASKLAPVDLTGQPRILCEKRK